MTQFRNFEDIQAWQEARILIRNIRGICKHPEMKRDYGLCDQMTRASRSIAANIAEGNDASTNIEFARFLVIAKRSAAEVRSHLYDALDEGYIDKTRFDLLNDQCIKITRMLAKLIHHLQNTNPGLKRTFKQSALETGLLLSQK